MGVKLGAILCTAMVALTLNGGTPNEKKLSKEGRQHNNENVILNKEVVNDIVIGNLEKGYKIIDLIRKDKAKWGNSL
ncbi:hypothetical protein [Clostridium massiliamazoniense]|uniref:hypothetical protein n=1 Tax=Clostridium massiliamazoniense TaxID=1347366 RepID=UPI0006D7A402|nr:hypothetical protein [Clostridium massiliamazoniense]